MTKKRKKKETVHVYVGDVKTRNTWGNVKPYTRYEDSSKVYNRKGRSNDWKREECCDEQ